MIDIGKLKRLSEWPDARRRIQEAVESVVGKPSRNTIDLQVKTAEEIDGPGYVRRRINYFVDEWMRISAWMFVPDGKDEKPAIVCLHRMTVSGKDETAGIEGMPLLAFAQHYAERGYVTIAPDCITAGDRVSSGLGPYDTKAFYKDYPKLSALGKMLADHMRCVDVLLDSRMVDGRRIGVIGHDLGGYNALLLSAFDERVQACVSSCGFTRFTDDKDPARWSRDTGFVILPKLKDAVKKRSFPFDWEHLLALIAPSPTLVITALNDEVLSNTKSCEKAVKSAKNVYRLLGAEEALAHFVHEGGHQMTPQALEAADEWFERWL